MFIGNISTDFVSSFVSGLAAARQQPGNLLLLKVTVLCLAPAPAQVCITTSRTGTSSCAVAVRMDRLIIILAYCKNVVGDLRKVISSSSMVSALSSVK